MLRVDHDLELRRSHAAALWPAFTLMLTLACAPDPEDEPEDFVNPTGASTIGTSGASSGTSEDSDSGASSATSEGSTSEGPTGDAATGESELLDISGDFLLAVSTTVDPSKPLQFIATNTMSEGGALSTCLQPLTLEVGKVLTPREPIGDQLCFTGLALVNGWFVIDAAEISVDGLANPITGANIVATLIMAGSIKSDELYCGAVTGELLIPPVGSIDGSSFAAVRLADKAVLPDPVVVDCAGTSVTDN